jgi:hypothetical protein
VIKQLLIGGPLLLLAACSFSDNYLLPHNRVHGLELECNDAVMKQRILEIVPVGTSVVKARSIMEDKGFICSLKSSQGFEYLLCKADLDGEERQTVFRIMMHYQEKDDLRPVTDVVVHHDCYEH